MCFRRKEERRREEGLKEKESLFSSAKIKGSGVSWQFNRFVCVCVCVLTYLGTPWIPWIMCPSTNTSRTKQVRSLSAFEYKSASSY